MDDHVGSQHLHGNGKVQVYAWYASHIVYPLASKSDGFIYLASNLISSNSSCVQTPRSRTITRLLLIQPLAIQLHARATPARAQPPSFDSLSHPRTPTGTASRAPDACVAHAAPSKRGTVDRTAGRAALSVRASRRRGAAAAGGSGGRASIARRRDVLYASRCRRGGRGSETEFLALRGGQRNVIELIFARPEWGEREEEVDEEEGAGGLHGVGHVGLEFFRGEGSVRFVNRLVG